MAEVTGIAEGASQGITNVPPVEDVRPPVEEVGDLEKKVESLQSESKIVSNMDKLAEETEIPIGENPSTNKELAEKPPAGKFLTIPGKIANDPEFQKIWGELCDQTYKEGKKVDIVLIDRDALSKYYNESAKTQLEKGLPGEIKNDPLYNQKLGEATAKAQENGELLDGNKLSQEALANYHREKDLQGEKPAESKTEELGSTEMRLKNLEDKIAALSLENTELKQNIATLTSTMKEVLPTIKILLEAEQAREQDPKKKESLAKLLLKLAAVAALVIFTEGAAEVNPIKTQG